MLDKAILKDPKLKEGYIQRGLCYENIKQDEKAISDYNTLLSFDPNNTTAFYYIGLCKYRQNKFQEAIENYDKALITKGVSNPSDTSSVQIVLDLNKNGILGDQAAFDVASYEIYYERGLAYRKDSAVNWCPSCQTVLANEQVVAGLCERCDSSVTKKKLNQWYFKITDYADRLLDDMAQLEGKWPDKVLTMQRNWIGRSTGANVHFEIEGRNQPVTIYTTRPDTLFGATFIKN